MASALLMSMAETAAAGIAGVDGTPDLTGTLGIAGVVGSAGFPGKVGVAGTDGTAGMSGAAKTVKGTRARAKQNERTMAFINKLSK